MIEQGSRVVALDESDVSPYRVRNGQAYDQGPASPI